VGVGIGSWSFTDVLSWLNGYQKRYGFVYIDRDETDEKTLRRIKKDSFYWYQEVIYTNGGNLFNNTKRSSKTASGFLIKSPPGRQ
jgi:6-phospho-beta-glucosidase